MQRVTVSLDESLADAFDELSKARGYQNRSEAVRDLMREAVEARRIAKHTSKYCVANLSFVFNHEERMLAERLTEAQHRHHDLVVSSMHVHLDHENCFESVILKGPTPAIQAFADHIRAERGVRFGNLNLVSVSPDDHHSADGPHRHKGHSHLSPQKG